MKRRDFPPSERNVPSKWSIELPIPAESSPDRVLPSRRGDERRDSSFLMMVWVSFTLAV